MKSAKDSPGSASEIQKTGIEGGATRGCATSFGVVNVCDVTASGVTNVVVDQSSAPVRSGPCCPRSNVPKANLSLDEVLFLSENQQAIEAAGLFFRLLVNSRLAYAFERSFAIRHKVLVPTRFGFGVRNRPYDRNREAVILSICQELGMPPDFMAAFQERLFESSIVHFGFEGTESRCGFKVYLNFVHVLQNRIASGPELLHLAFKWDALHSAKRVVTRYTWHPFLSAEGILDRIRGMHDAETAQRPLRVAERVLGIASARIGYDDILYLEATEEGNPRRSYDINLYKANLQMWEFDALFSGICQSYSIPSSSFRSLYDPIRTELLGHLQGGIDRTGEDFLNFYFGGKHLRRGRRRYLP